MLQLVMIALFITFGLGYFFSTILTSITVAAAHRFNVLARPSERASHTVPTPRLGGLGVAGAVTLAMILTDRLILGGAPYWLLALSVGGAWALVGGLLDDVLDLPASNKFLFQFVAAISYVVLGDGIRAIPLPGSIEIVFTPLMGSLFTIAFLIFWINAFNFMDGMDGQGALFAAMIAMGVYLPCTGRFMFTPEALLAATMAGASLGLFSWNYPGRAAHQKTFMGDAGSHFIGMVTGVLVLQAGNLDPVYRAPGLPFPAAVLLLWPFIFDVLYTLARRISRGENILQAHRTHLYQRLLVAGWSHGQALLLNQLFWLGCFGLAQIYVVQAVQRTTPPEVLWGLLGCGLVLSGIYVIIVHSVERRAAPATSVDNS